MFTTFPGIRFKLTIDDGNDEMEIVISYEYKIDFIFYFNFFFCNYNLQNQQKENQKNAHNSLYVKNLQL